MRARRPVGGTLRLYSDAEEDNWVSAKIGVGGKGEGRSQLPHRCYVGTAMHFDLVTMYLDLGFVLIAISFWPVVMHALHFECPDLLCLQNQCNCLSRR